jgi:KaiC/GvpD/RAD55 family RecA-like ATPase
MKNTQFFLVLIFSCVLLTCSAVLGQGETGFHFEAIRITVDIRSPIFAHVIRNVSISVDSSTLSFLDWGLWYDGKKVMITKAADTNQQLKFIYPVLGSDPQRPVLRIQFPHPIDKGESYNFIYEYDVSSNAPSFSWIETLDTSQVLIRSLAIRIQIPSGYHFTEITPSSATTSSNEGRLVASWLGTELYDQPLVGLTVGFTTESVDSLGSLMQFLPYAVGVGGFILFGLYEYRRRRAGRVGHAEPEEILEGAIQELQTENVVSSGLPVLDYLLRGGLPRTSTTLITSPACDERDSVLRKYLEKGAKAGGRSIYVAKDISKIDDLIQAYGSNMMALVTTPAKGAEYTSLRVTSKPENLTAISIDLKSALTDSQVTSKPKILCVDLLDDVLLLHGPTLTRKWLADVLMKTKNFGFTVLATLNSQIHSPSNLQAVIELFDGHIEIIERDIDDTPKRIIRVRKMQRRKFLETEAVLSRDRLI